MATGVHTFHFVLVTEGADLLDWKTLDALYEAGCGDATVGHDTLEFDRTASTRDEALCSAMRDAESVPGVRVLRIELCTGYEPMASTSHWEDIKSERGEPSDEARTGVEQDLALGQLIYDLRIEVGLSQRELAERMGTTQSVISRLEEGGGACNRIDTLARVATALGRHLVLSFPAEAPDRLEDAIQVA